MFPYLKVRQKLVNNKNGLSHRKTCYKVTQEVLGLSRPFRTPGFLNGVDDRNLFMSVPSVSPILRSGGGSEVVPR